MFLNGRTILVLQVFRYKVLIEFLIHYYFVSETAQQLRQHYLLSGDADGTIMLWEVSLTDGKVLLQCFTDRIAILHY